MWNQSPSPADLQTLLRLPSGSCLHAPQPSPILQALRGGSAAPGL
jgi:hypothetical protein